jgi:predicted AAA+ superfamily ATPase
LRLLNEHPDRIWQIIPRNDHVRQIVLIDEIQYLANPSHFLKYHYDINLDRLKLIATGSSAFYLDKQFNDSLAGRKRIFHLPTLGIKEFLTFKDRSDLAKALDSIDSEQPDLQKLTVKQSREIITLSDEYLIYGGYPAVVLAPTLADKQEILYDLFTSYLKRDFLESGITQTDKAYHLLKLLAFQIGSELNKNKLSTEIGIAKPLLENMLNTFQTTFHLSLIRPFYNGHPKELRKMPKVYLMDLGLRNAILKNYNPIPDRDDVGKLYENYIYRYFTDTFPQSDINYWRTQSGQEVDFILDGKRAYEVKWNGKQIMESKYQKFNEAYPDIKLKHIARLNSLQQSLLL